MKTIEISDEMYAALMEISADMNTQDNRCTASPYFFQIQTQEEISVPEGCGTEIWIDDDGRTLRDESEESEFIINHLAENEESLHDITDNEAYAAAKATYKNMNDDAKVEWLEEHGWRMVNVSTRNVYKNAFFTEKACRKHIQINGHNLTKPRTYVEHAYRNAEMELVVKFLKGLNKTTTKQN